MSMFRAAIIFTFINFLAVNAYAEARSGFYCRDEIRDRSDCELSGTALIIFIHGFTGDSVETWSATKELKGSWFDIIRSDPEIDQSKFDIFTLNYPSKGRWNPPSIQTVIDSELEYFKNLGLFDQYQHIIFVGHSMGGIIAKGMVDRMLTRYPKDLQHVHGVFLIAVPSNGNGLARLGARFLPNRQLKGLRDKGASDWLVALEEDWNSIVRERGEEFPFSSFAAVETEPMRLGRFGRVGIIVDRAGAITYVSDGILTKITDADHVSISKPVDATSRTHVWFRAKLLSLPVFSGDPAGDAKSNTVRDDAMRDGACGTFFSVREIKNSYVSFFERGKRQSWTFNVTSSVTDPITGKTEFEGEGGPALTVSGTAEGSQYRLTFDKKPNRSDSWNAPWEIEGTCTPVGAIGSGGYVDGRGSRWEYAVAFE